MLSQNLMKINAELATGLSNQLLINPYKTKLDIFGSRVMISKTMKDRLFPTIMILATAKDEFFYT